MAKNESVEFYLRSLKERFAAFKKAFNSLLQVLTLNDTEKKIAATKDVLTTIDFFKTIISSKDHPPWVTKLEDKLNWYIQSARGSVVAGGELLRTIMALNSEIENQSWDFSDSSDAIAVDFNEVYKQCYLESRIPELFEDLISQLEIVLQSGCVDSIIATKALEKLIKTIKKNSQDLFAAKGAWDVAKVFLKHLMFELCDSVPVLKEVVNASKNTCTELDIEFDKVFVKTQNCVIAVANEDLPKLPDRQFLIEPPKEYP